MSDRLTHEKALEAGVVSIIMPAYNAEETLGDSIASIISQTFQNWELLIVDDNSHDATLLLARSAAELDHRIRVIHLEQNGGVSVARNAGILAANGQYLAFLDSDDLWLPQKLAIQVAFMQRNQAEFSFTGYRRVKNNGHLGGVITVPSKVDYSQLLKGNVIGCLTAMIDRQRIPSITMPQIGHEDYATWLQILKRGHHAWGIPEDLARYRMSSGSVSGNKWQSIKWTWNIYRCEEKLSLLRSMWSFVNYSVNAIHRNSK